MAGISDVHPPDTNPSPKRAPRRYHPPMPNADQRPRLIAGSLAPPGPTRSAPDRR